MGQVETKVDVLAVLDECIKSQNDALANWSHEYLHEARAAVAVLIEAAKDVEWNARMTAPDDTYHEVGRKEMSRLTAALARVGGAA